MAENKQLDLDIKIDEVKIPVDLKDIEEARKGLEEIYAIGLNEPLPKGGKMKDKAVHVGVTEELLQEAKKLMEEMKTGNPINNMDNSKSIEIFQKSLKEFYKGLSQVDKSKISEEALEEVIGYYSQYLQNNQDSSNELQQINHNITALLSLLTQKSLLNDDELEYETKEVWDSLNFLEEEQKGKAKELSKKFIGGFIDFLKENGVKEETIHSLFSIGLPNGYLTEEEIIKQAKQELIKQTSKSKPKGINGEYTNNQIKGLKKEDIQKKVNEIKRRQIENLSGGLQSQSGLLYLLMGGRFRGVSEPGISSAEKEKILEEETRKKGNNFSEQAFNFAQTKLNALKLERDSEGKPALTPKQEKDLLEAIARDIQFVLDRQETGYEEINKPIIGTPKIKGKATLSQGLFNSFITDDGQIIPGTYLGEDPSDPNKHMMRTNKSLRISAQKGSLAIPSEIQKILIDEGAIKEDMTDLSSSSLTALSKVFEILRKDDLKDNEKGQKLANNILNAIIEAITNTQERELLDQFNEWYTKLKKNEDGTIQLDDNGEPVRLNQGALRNELGSDKTKQKIRGAFGGGKSQEAKDKVAYLFSDRFKDNVSTGFEQNEAVEDRTSRAIMTLQEAKEFESELRKIEKVTKMAKEQFQAFSEGIKELSNKVKNGEVELKNVSELVLYFFSQLIEEAPFILTDINSILKEKFGKELVPEKTLGDTAYHQYYASRVDKDAGKVSERTENSEVLTSGNEPTGEEYDGRERFLNALSAGKESIFDIITGREKDEGLSSLVSGDTTSESNEALGIFIENIFGDYDKLIEFIKEELKNGSSDSEMATKIINLAKSLKQLPQNEFSSLFTTEQSSNLQDIANEVQKMANIAQVGSKGDNKKFINLLLMGLNGLQKTEWFRERAKNGILDIPKLKDFKFISELEKDETDIEPEPFIAENLEMTERDAKLQIKKLLGQITSKSRSTENIGGELRDSFSIILDLVKEMIPDADMSLFDNINTTQGQSALIMANRFANLYRFSDQVDISNQRLVDEINKKAGKEIITLTEQTKKWKQENPDQVEQYDLSSKVKEIFNANGGINEIKKALQAVFDSKELKGREGKPIEVFKQFYEAISEIITVFKEELDEQGKLILKKDRVDNAQDEFELNLFRRLDKTKSKGNPNAKGSVDFSDVDKHTGLDISTSGMSYTDATMLKWQGGQVGLAYGGKNLEDSLAKANKKLEWLRQQEVTELNEILIQQTKQDIELLKKALSNNLYREKNSRYQNVDKDINEEWYTIFDTETTGTEESALPVTFAGYQSRKGKKIKKSQINKILTYSTEEETWQYLVEAMNLRDKETQELIDSSLQLRKRFGLTEDNGIDTKDIVFGNFNFFKKKYLDANIKNENGQTMREVLDADKMSADELWDWLLKWSKNSKMAGFNSESFDIKKLINYFTKNGKFITETSEWEQIFGQNVDVREIFFELFGDSMYSKNGNPEGRSQYVKNAFKLQGLRKFFYGEENEEAHDALSDVEDTEKILKLLTGKSNQAKKAQNAVKLAKEMIDSIMEAYGLDYTEEDGTNTEIFNEVTRIVMEVVGEAYRNSKSNKQLNQKQTKNDIKNKVTSNLSSQFDIFKNPPVPKTDSSQDSFTNTSSQASKKWQDEMNKLETSSRDGLELFFKNHQELIVDSQAFKDFYEQLTDEAKINLGKWMNLSDESHYPLLNTYKNMEIEYDKSTAQDRASNIIDKNLYKVGNEFVKLGDIDFNKFNLLTFDEFLKRNGLDIFDDNNNLFNEFYYSLNNAQMQAIKSILNSIIAEYNKPVDKQDFSKFSNVSGAFNFIENEGIAQEYGEPQNFENESDIDLFNISERYPSTYDAVDSSYDKNLKKTYDEVIQNLFKAIENINNDSSLSQSEKEAEISKIKAQYNLFYQNIIGTLNDIIRDFDDEDIKTEAQKILGALSLTNTDITNKLDQGIGLTSGGSGNDDGFNGDGVFNIPNATIFVEHADKIDVETSGPITIDSSEGINLGDIQNVNGSLGSNLQSDDINRLSDSINKQSDLLASLIKLPGMGNRNNQNEEITIEALDFDYDDEKHLYTTKDGKKILSSTEIRDIYLGRNKKDQDMLELNNRYAKAKERIQNGKQLGQLTANDMQMSDSEFQKKTGWIATGLYGNLFHKAIELFALTGKESLDDLDDASRQEFDGLKAEIEQQLSFYGIDPDEYLKTIQPNINAYMDAYQQIGKALGLSLTQFSEIPLAMKISKGDKSYNVAGTLDQFLFNPAIGQGAFIDSKTGKIGGYEAFQLTIQKLLAQANKDNPVLKNVLKDKDGNPIDVDFEQIFTGYVADIKNGTAQFIKNTLLDLEKVWEIVDRVYKQANGEIGNLPEKVAIRNMNGQMSSGRFWGHDSDYVNVTNDDLLSGGRRVLGNNNEVEERKQAEDAIEEYLDAYEKLLKLGEEKAVLKKQLAKAETKQDKKLIKAQLAINERDTEEQKDRKKEYISKVNSHKVYTQEDYDYVTSRREEIDRNYRLESNLSKAEQNKIIADQEEADENQRINELLQLRLKILRQIKEAESDILQAIKDYNKETDPAVKAERETKLEDLKEYRSSLMKDFGETYVRTDLQGNTILEPELIMTEEQQLDWNKVQKDRTKISSDLRTEEIKRQAEEKSQKEKQKLEEQNKAMEEYLSLIKQVQEAQKEYNKALESQQKAKPNQQDAWNETVEDRRQQLETAKSNLENYGGIQDNKLGNVELTEEQTRALVEQEEILKRIDELERIRHDREVALNSDNSTKNEAKINKAIKEIIDQKKELINYEVLLQRAEQDYGRLNTSGQRDMLKAIDNYKQRINELKNSSLQYNEGNKTITTSDGEELALNTEQVHNLEKELGDIESKKVSDIAKQNIRYQEQRGILTQIVDSFKNEFKNLFDYRIGNEIFNYFQNSIRQIIELTKQLNSNMVDLQIASGESYSNIYELSKSFNELGRELGRSTSDVMTAANDWLRAGYTSQEAAELTKASMQLSTLGMINSSDATSYLISTMKGWKMEAQEVSNVVDKLSAIDFQAAVSSGDLAEAISRSSVSAQKAGLDLDTFLGYVTVVQETTQKSAEVVGSSFQTLFSRYQNAAAGKFSATQEEIESGNYNEDDYSNINDIEKALKALGINVRSSIDQFRDFDEILEEIAGRWDTFSNVQQAGIATSLAGTRQRENFLVLMENWDSVSRYAKIAAESQGTAAQKMEAYTDSIEAAKQRVTVAFEKLALDIGATDAIKSFYNMLTYLADNLGKVAITLTTVLGLAKGKDILQFTVNGFTGLTNGLIKTNNVYSNIFSGGFNIEGIKTAGKNFIQSIEEQQKNLIGEKYVKLMNQRGGIVTQSLQAEAEQLQTNLTNLDLSKTKVILDNKLLSLSDEQLNQKMNELVDSGQLEDANKKQIVAIRKLTNSTNSLTDKQREVALETAQLRKEEATQLNLNPISNIAGRVGALAGISAGTIVFNTVSEELLGEGWGPLGSAIGSQIGLFAGTALGEGIGTFINSKSLTAMFTQIGWVGGAALVATVAAGLYTAYKNAESKVLKELKQDFQKKQEKYTQTINQSVNVGEYDKLAEGVDSLGRNISLTEEDYQKFLETSNQLAEAFPELVQRVDSNGNKLLGVGGKVGKVTEAVDDLTESLKEARAEALLAEKDMGFWGFGHKTSQIDEALQDYQKALEEEEKAKNKVKTIETEEKNELLYSLPDEIYDIVPVNDDPRNTETTKVIKDNWEEYYDNIISNAEEQLKGRKNLDNYTITKIEEQLKNAKEEKEQVKKILEDLNNEVYKESDSVIEAKDFAKKKEEDRKESRKSLNAFVDAVIDADPVLRNFYNNLSDEQKQFYDYFKDSFNFDDINDREEFLNYLTEEFKKIGELIDTNPEIEVQLKAFYNINEEQLISDYLKEREKFKDFIQSLIDNDTITEQQGIDILGKVQFTPVYDSKGQLKDFVDETDYIKAIEDDGLDKKLSVGTLDEMKKIYTEEQVKLAHEFLEQTKGINYSIEELNEVVAKMKYNSNSALEDIISGYKKLSLKSKLNDVEKVQKRIIEEQMTKWAKRVGVVAENYDELIKKAERIGDLTDVGTISDKTLEEVMEDGSVYKEYLDYLNNDFDGSWDSEMWSKMVDDIELTDFIVLGDINGLKNKIKEILSDFQKQGDNVYQNSLLKSKAVYSNFLENNEDLVKELNEIYKTDLSQFTTMEEAKNSINTILTGDLCSTWDEWRKQCLEIYKVDAESFGSFAQRKMQLNNIMFKSLKASADENNISLGLMSESAFYDAQRQSNQYDKNNKILQYGSYEEYIQDKRSELLDMKMDRLNAEFETELNKYKATDLFASKSDSSSDSELPDESWTTKDRLEALEELIDKEWEAMKVFDEFNGVELKDTEYFKLMAESLNTRLDETIKQTEKAKEKMLELKKIADSYGRAQTEKAIEARNEFGEAEKDYIDLQKEQIEIQKQIADLDDEQLEDELNRAETMDYSLETLIKINKELLNAADTEDERIERNQKILDLLKDQYEEYKRIRDFYADFAESTRDLYSGSAITNAADYDKMMSYRLKYSQVNAQKILEERNRLYSVNYEKYLKESNGNEEWAKYMAENSEDVQEKTNEYLDEVKNQSDLIVQNYQDKIEEFDNRLELLEKAKPSEWTGVSQIKAYYTESIGIMTAKLNQLYVALQDVAFMTDDQIKELVNQINDVAVAIQEAKINMQQDLIDQQSSVYDAIVSKVEEYKSAIQDQIDAIEEAYEKEIKPIQTANQERERAITLEEKLQAIKNKEQEKTRVFRMGIGWVLHIK